MMYSAEILRARYVRQSDTKSLTMDELTEEIAAPQIKAGEEAKEPNPSTVMQNFTYTQKLIPSTKKYALLNCYNHAHGQIVFQNLGSLFHKLNANITNAQEVQDIKWCLNESDPDKLIELACTAAFDGRTFKAVRMKMAHHKGIQETSNLLHSEDSFAGKILACGLSQTTIGFERLFFTEPDQNPFYWV